MLINWKSEVDAKLNSEIRASTESTVSGALDSNSKLALRRNVFSIYNMLWIYHIKRHYDMADERKAKTGAWIHANAYKGIQIELWLCSLFDCPSFIVPSVPSEAWKFCIYIQSTKRRGIGASFCPQLYSRNCFLYATLETTIFFSYFSSMKKRNWIN